MQASPEKAGIPARGSLNEVNVSLRLLRAFVAVGNEGNVGRAAARLFVSQPSLSQDIRRLERAVGTDLFVRGPHGVRLTPAGEVLLRDVEAALTLLGRGVDRARATAAAERLRVVLSFSPSIGHHLIPALLPALEQRLPGVAVDEREVDTGDVATGILAGRFDLGLAHCVPVDPELSATPLGDDPLCVAVATDHPLAQRGGPLQLSELDGLSLLLWPRETAPEYYDHMLAVCARAGLHPSVVPGPRRTLIRSYVLTAGDVFCLLPAATSRMNVPEVSFLAVSDEAAVVPLVLIRRRGEDRPEVLETEAAVIAEAEHLDLRHPLPLP
jgi:LysR family transcriptional regulator, benzoate and cis,cis-muconate-responsive activator of ben and cat genes